MTDFLDILTESARETVKRGYYEVRASTMTSMVSLKESICRCSRAPIIAEIKAGSPSKGTLKENIEADRMAQSYSRGGAIGISVLTEPKHFGGSLEAIATARKFTELPILMKDIIICSKQLETASILGSNAVLLIQALFDRKYCERGVEEMIEEAHGKKLEVLLETHDEKEFQRALASEADLIGINNRNLRTLEVNLDVTRRLLEKTDCKGKLIVSESGIESPADIRFLSSYGAKAFLVGSTFMKAIDAEDKVKELVGAL